MKLEERIELPLTMTKNYFIKNLITRSWSKISPFWPLKNLIAVNPLAGFEDLPFEEALKEANAYFQQKEMPNKMQEVNRHTIKWLQAFFDEGQSTIHMPMRNHGLLKSILSLIRFDGAIHKHDKKKLQWLQKLPENPESIIETLLLFLDIPSNEQEQFLILMLTTLPGWSAYIQYRTSWLEKKDSFNAHPVTNAEYLALRLVLTSLIWPKAKALLNWHDQAIKNADIKMTYQKIIEKELLYQKGLLKNFISFDEPKEKTRTSAQFVFCIDVRSEPFRRSVENQGNYETFGFAGFFGIPVAIQNSITKETHTSCPVLLQPEHTIIEKPTCSYEACKNGYEKQQKLKKIYQSLKYTFTTPFSLVETIGLISGIWMSLRNFAPLKSSAIQLFLKKILCDKHSFTPEINSIPIDLQVGYSERALKMIGLTENFAPLVIFCGHGSSTLNNAYATALDCGACGGHPGAPNARILAEILNSREVRSKLKEKEIKIPEETWFLGAQHNTTTDEVELYEQNLPKSFSDKIESLKQDLKKAQSQNSLCRSREFGIKTNIKRSNKITLLRSKDWAEVRPEWGLAKNAAFIIGPRSLTKNIDLQGRSFLHSYEWKKDCDQSSLTTILTAPMVVAQWINAQYLFSSIDNVAFGGGSKITKNIAGKIGVMQGNASDLMHGLPLQSVYKSDTEVYHEQLRLTVIVYAPQLYITPIIKKHSILEKLFGNGWINLICCDPTIKSQFILKRDFSWQKWD